MDRLRAGAIRALLGRGVSAADVAALRLKDVRENVGVVRLRSGRVLMLRGSDKAALSRWGRYRRAHLGAGVNRRAYLVGDTGKRLTAAEVLGVVGATPLGQGIGQGEGAAAPRRGRP